MQQAIQAQARIAIEFSVQSGFENLIDFLENEYLLNVRPGIRVYSGFQILKSKIYVLRNCSLLLT